MNTSRTLIALLLVPLILQGCSSTLLPVPLIGSRNNIAALEGEWHGSYSSTDTGRSGSILFVLTAEADTASGDVIMYPLEWEDCFYPESVNSTMSEEAPQQLKIDFVQVGGDRVAGRLAPYREPEEGCTLHTVFEGRLRGDTIEGTFTARGVEWVVVQTGHWRVTRKQ